MHGLSKIFSDGLFAAFNSMCVILKDLPQRLLAKFEACRCCLNAEQLEELKAEGRERQTHTFAFNACPMVGKVAPYLASGEHLADLTTMADCAEIEVLRECCAALTEGDRATIIDNYHSAVAHIHYVLKLKTQSWEVLPWSLCGLAHPHMQTAKAHAEVVLRQLTVDVPAHSHHRLTKPFLAADMVEQLRHWARSGEGLEQHPRLHEEIAKMFFIPCFERGGERLHALLRRGTEFKNVGGPYCSLVLRCPQMTRDLRATPDNLHELAKYVDAARTIGKIEASLGMCIAEHPRFADGIKSTTAFLSKLLYRLDPSEQHRAHDDQHKKHLKATAQRQKLATAHLPRPRRTHVGVQDAVRSSLFLTHFRRLADENLSVVYSLPAACFEDPDSGLGLVDMVQMMSTPQSHRVPKLGIPVADVDDLRVDDAAGVDGAVGLVGALAPREAGEPFDSVDGGAELAAAIGELDVGREIFFRIVKTSPHLQKAVGASTHNEHSCPHIFVVVAAPSSRNLVAMDMSRAKNSPGLHGTKVTCCHSRVIDACAEGVLHHRSQVNNVSIRKSTNARHLLVKQNVNSDGDNYVRVFARVPLQGCPGDSGDEHRIGCRRFRCSAVGPQDPQNKITLSVAVLC